MQESPDPSILMQQFFVLLESLIPMFALCMTAEELSNQFEEFDIYQKLDFYTFPSKIQRMLTYLIMNTQIPLVFEAYGKAACNRETFKKVSICHILTVKYWLCLNFNSEH